MKLLAKQSKRISVFLIGVMVGQLVSPLSVFALTGGPSQPEVQSFSPVSSSDMVDLFTGDFNYNIPLMDVDGYPLNLSYTGGVSMDQEASWVGLGWNLNPGVINRNMRGLPDDFKGDLVKSQVKMKTNATYSVGVGVKPEFFGYEFGMGQVGLKLSAGLHYNNYRGLGMDFGIDPSIGANGGSGSLSAGLGMNFSSSDGFSADLQTSAGVHEKSMDNSMQGGYGLNASIGYNSRGGLKSLNTGMNINFSNSHKNTFYGTNISGQFLGSNQTFGTQTYTPSISTSSVSDGVSLSYGWGPEFLGANGKMTVNASINKTKYPGTEQSKEAYGYLFSEKKVEDDVLLDFNREKDIPFIESSAYLPLPTATYDMFSVSAQGMGGTFRTYRNDFPMFHDDTREQNFTKRGERKKLISSSLGAEFGGVKTLKLGVNLNMIFNKTYSGIWTTDNELKNKLNFVNSVSNDPSFEPSYFKMLGEFSPLKTTTVNEVGGKNLVSPTTSLKYLSAILKDYSSIKKPNTYAYRSYYAAPLKIKYSGRERRNKLISYLNAKEANMVGLDKYITTFVVDEPSNYPTPIAFSRLEGYRQPHHMSEVTVTSEDGQRFVYGIPAYNTKYIEKSFAITPTGNSSATIYASCGQVAYQNQDNSIENNKGIENYYSSKETPPYTHSFLLTGILSADYVDIGNDGISDDDLGTATKFNYSLKNSNFKWRVPYLANRANYQEGNKTTTLDDKGSFLYGEKEIWYLREVEGKNHIAVFELEARHDGYGVEGENGGLSTDMKSYMVKKIILYAKKDYQEWGSGAYPIKTVHFVYDYSLCKNVENNDEANISINENRGKLTLKSLYFTYGKSNKGRLSPYVFKYSGLNPYYNLKGNDRWGTFKPNSGSSGLTGNPNNAEFPYTMQIKDSADLYCSAWSLTEVVLPSGGKIIVTYESDDYAYVQDKKAMHMFNIEGFSEEFTGDKSTSSFIFDKKHPRHPKNYAYFKLDKQITGSNKDAVFREQYLGGITTVQFNILALVSSSRNESYEYVKVYADIDPSKSGVTNDGLSGYLYLQPKAIVSRKEDNDAKRLVNPLTKGVWQFIRSQVPHQLHPFSDQNNKYDESKDRKVLSAMATAFSKVSKVVSGGMENYMYDQGYGSKVKLNKSWVRLNDPDGRKYGGGQRVKRITMNDDWAAMSQDTGVENQTYGQEYIYEKTDTINHQIISSGVAAYEPSIGSDENPFRNPISTIEELKWAPDMIHSTDEPIGESYSPAPIVGYSEVKIIPLIPSGIIKQQTGYTLNTFYTAKDFPFSVVASPITKSKVEPVFGAFLEKKIYHTTVSQGYLIETNDMHGKPKGQFIFNSKGNQVSGSDNVYAFDPKNPKKLDNNVKTIKNDGTMSDAELGVTVDFFSDVRESKSNTLIGSGQFNMDVFNIAFVIVPVVTLFYFPKQEDRIFQSAVVVKHVNRIGILKKTIAHQEGSRIITENLKYDYETGQVLLTSVQNEYHDNIYNFTYPAHWAYDKGMGQGYKNTGLVLESITFNNGNDYIPEFSGQNLNKYLVAGDECLLTNLGTEETKIVYAYRGKDTVINFIDFSGQVIGDPTNQEYSVKVVRSGRRNMQSIPIGSVTTLKNPAKTSTLAFDSILNSTASEYSDNWAVNCNEMRYRHEICDSNLDFIYGFNALFNILPNDTQETTEFSDASSIYNSSSFFRNYYKVKCRDKNKRNNTLALYNSSESGNAVIRKDTTFNSFIVKLRMYGDACGCDEFTLMTFKFYALDTILFNSISRFTTSAIFRDSLISGSPGLSYQFKINARLNDSSDIELTGFNKCQDFIQCYSVCEIIPLSEFVNPIKSGLNGNWRKVKDYAFSGNRKYESSKSMPRRDGVYDQGQYTNFWKKESSPIAATGSYYGADKTNDKWVWTNEVTIYSPHGPELENRNALDIYSSALYGFRHTLPLAVASNARYRQIGYESFEDLSSLMDCENGHFSFMVNLGPKAVLDYTTKHSGKTSLKVKQDSAQTLHIIWQDTTSENFVKIDSNFYRKSKTDCIGTFMPDSGYYIIGAWVRDSVSALDTTFSHPEIILEVDKGGVNTTYHFKSTGLIIDGWQRIEGRFKIPANITSIKFKLQASSDNCSWFDDIRVHPLSGNMKSYAYDPGTLRLMADLDENNYASFYEYDLEGNLARLKRETEKGIMTIKETKSSVKGAK